MTARILPAQQIEEVDRVIDGLIRDAARYDNSELLDESQCWSLHKLAAELYAAGFEDGQRAEATRVRGQRARDVSAANRSESGAG
ncbi:MAG: hypothetical protein WKF57_06560 [Nakamurella sp.]